jgi:phytol kinase
MRGLSAACRTGQLSPEAARKSLHVVLGLATLACPWIVDGPLPILVLAALVCAWFEAVRYLPGLRQRYGPVLFAVARQGRGETHFVIGAAACFVLADGSALFFCLPMAVLSLADSAAAMLGRRYGSRPGAIRYGSKSLAGSGAFFVIACVVSLVALTMAGWAATPSWTAALMLGGTTSLVEGLSRNGNDNLFVPLAAACLLQALPEPLLLPPGSALLS